VIALKQAIASAILLKAIALGGDRFKSGDVYDGLRLRTPNIHILVKARSHLVVIGLK
jgi:hypothetical protein